LSNSKIALSCHQRAAEQLRSQFQHLKQDISLIKKELTQTIFEKDSSLIEQFNSFKEILLRKDIEIKALKQDINNKVLVCHSKEKEDKIIKLKNDVSELKTKILNMKDNSTTLTFKNKTLSDAMLHKTKEIDFKNLQIAEKDNLIRTCKKDNEMLKDMLEKAKSAKESAVNKLMRENDLAVNKMKERLTELEAARRIKKIDRQVKMLLLSNF
jgi:hypothetical protein